MKKAIGYIRVSTDGQAESGLSLEAQRKKIEAYAILKDLELVEIIEDAGISAKNLNRPGMQRLLDLVHRGGVDAVIIYKLDRMCRNTIDALETASIMDKRGVALHSIEESLDTQSAIGKFFFTLIAALAEMERKLIGERTRTALKQKRERGEKTGGHVPYGWEVINGKLKGNAAEQEILYRMRTMQRDGMSYQKIADALNSQGLPSKTGKLWNSGTVYRILQNAA